ncbi:hydroxyquinol 1,2-dioxygenase [Cupriavidus sp. UYMSc13B]|uniref:hypothetical protein n=1 Tax=Cupriavidus sp. UYPR2.512 TaxID=1080187 RepID=UPI00035EB055|nr:hypothetical protein [Cupriavidus sp. UYPR2.512]RWA54963.1 hydroxyquinol 1,2-dioxygenase [Cupriavidus sp. UYMSc13B]UIF90832.1 hydroxyquinol 1,2-dioxygenase [Cupriavidus necator]
MQALRQVFVATALIAAVVGTAQAAPRNVDPFSDGAHSATGTRSAFTDGAHNPNGPRDSFSDGA